MGMRVVDDLINCTMNSNIKNKFCYQRISEEDGFLFGHWTEIFTDADSDAKIPVERKEKICDIDFYKNNVMKKRSKRVPEAWLFYYFNEEDNEFPEALFYVYKNGKKLKDYK